MLASFLLLPLILAPFDGVYPERSRRTQGRLSPWGEGTLSV